MQIVGINDHFQGNAMALALKSVGLKSTPKARWPRKRGSVRCVVNEHGTFAVKPERGTKKNS